MSVAETSRNNNNNKKNNNKTNAKWLVVDFDDTCTVRNTVPLLPRLAGLFEQESRLSDNDKNENVDDIVQERIRLFTNLEQEYLKMSEKVNAKFEKDMDKHNNITTLFQALEQFDEVSKQIEAMVTSSGVLKGLRANQDCTNQMQRLVQKHSLDIEMPLREHCGSVLSKIHQSDDWNLGVLSVNWCPSLIATVLQPYLVTSTKTSSNGGRPDGADHDDMETIPMPPIWCNTVDAETGTIHSTVLGAMGKQQRIIQLRMEHNKSDGSIIVIFVGDSTTDLAALIESDIGILIGKSESARRMAEKWGGVSLVPLKLYPTTTTTIKEEGEEKKNVIWTTECWSEIASLLLSTDDQPAWLK
eukprot:scaffold321_cov95-Cylindrotheca_fusiformis.AAC.9